MVYPRDFGEDSLFKGRGRPEIEGIVAEDAEDCHVFSWIWPGHCSTFVLNSEDIV